jgi:hypothetical protein
MKFLQPPPLFALPLDHNSQACSQEDAKTIVALEPRDGTFSGDEAIGKAGREELAKIGISGP